MLVDTVEFKENNRILLRKVNFAFMIPNPSLDCSYVVLNFWPSVSAGFETRYRALIRRLCKPRE